MNALLVRIGADQSNEGGRWNGVIDGGTNEFVYVPIPESAQVHAGFEKPYALLQPALTRLGLQLAPCLAGRNMHLDPDFEHLTYGDRGMRGRQLRAQLRRDDWVVFYASLADVRGRGRLSYALMGVLVVECLMSAREFPLSARDCNAHSRRVLAPSADDVVVVGRKGISGRLKRCLPVGEWRAGAYRVRKDLLAAWGGLSVKDGWLQRSARLPRFLDPGRFREWFVGQGPELVPVNNP